MQVQNFKSSLLALMGLGLLQFDHSCTPCPTLFPPPSLSTGSPVVQSGLDCVAQASLGIMEVLLPKLPESWDL